jgi:hypothetical protein
MHIRNLHSRWFSATADRVGALLDTLASEDDLLWPRDAWPAMRLDRGLTVGAEGGHGPIRYRVEAYEPSRSVRFRFTAPDGFRGSHTLVVRERDGGAILEHLLEMEATGAALLSWPLVFRPLHDALLEDALDRCELALTGSVRAPSRWSPYVRVLRRAMRAVRRPRRRAG